MSNLKTVVATIVGFFVFTLLSQAHAGDRIHGRIGYSGHPVEIIIGYSDYGKHHFKHGHFRSHYYHEPRYYKHRRKHFRPRHYDYYDRRGYRHYKRDYHRPYYDRHHYRRYNSGFRNHNYRYGYDRGNRYCPRY